MSVFGNPEVEPQLNASETIGRRLFIIDEAIKGLERTAQVSNVSQEVTPIRTEIERLKLIRRQQEADLGIEEPDAFLDNEEYLQELEKAKQDRQAELARRDIINSQEFDQKAAA